MIKKQSSCPVCHSKQITFQYAGHDILYKKSKKKFTIYKCQMCHAFFLNPLPSSVEASTFYPKTYYSYQNQLKKSFFAQIKQLILESNLAPKCTHNLYETILTKIFTPKFGGLPLYKKRNGDFLDIGCGSGENLLTMKKYGWRCHGIEINQRAVKIAKKNGLQVKKTSLAEAHFNHRFDYIRIWHVFEHLALPNQSMSKLKKLLKTDGEIALAVPNTHSLAQIVFKQYWYNLDVPRHLINYSPKTLQWLINKHGLKITELKYATAGSLVGSFSNFLKANFGLKKNLINNVFLVFLCAPFDYLADLLHLGDIIFIKIQKK